MAFVNEYVPDEYIKKYGLEEIDERYHKGHFRPDWTIDRARNVYLRWMSPGREDLFDHNYFTFYWKGMLMDVELKRVGERDDGGRRSTTWTLVNLSLPEGLFGNRSEIIADLKLALSEFKDFGIGSKLAEHTAKFEF